MTPVQRKLNTENIGEVFIYATRAGFTFPYNGKATLLELWTIPENDLKKIHSTLKGTLPEREDEFAEFDSVFGDNSPISNDAFDTQCKMNIILHIYRVRRTERLEKIEGKKRRDEAIRKAAVLKKIADEGEMEEMRKKYSPSQLRHLAEELEQRS